MSEYMIMTDSTVDLPKEYLTEELGVPYIPLTYLIDGQSYEDMIGLTGEEFFAKVRAGSMPTTSQINPEQAREALEPYLKEGKDILYIAFSSGLSGTYNSIRMAAEELQEEYPERKLIVIDSLCACMGEGLLVYKAVQLKRAGKSLEEVAAWVEENKLHIMHNGVETFDEYNTGKNVGKGTPTVFWDIVPNSDKCEIYTYMAGGGCTLPGKAMVLMPGEGYEGVTKFVLDVMTSYGLNACPPLLVGVGVATSVETAALLSKKALMRPIGSHNDNERAAKMENLLEDGINAIGLGPQGMGGKYSVMGVNIENTARHPSAIGVAVNVGCWSHRRGHIVFDKDLNYTITTHSGVEL